MLYENEFKNDYSMGYIDRIGFRAGTATPFNFYDVSREFQLSLKLIPIFATEESLKKGHTRFLTSSDTLSQGFESMFGISFDIIG